MEKKNDYNPGDKVFAKVKGHPPWPARINFLPPDVKIPKGKFPIFFHGTHEVYFLAPKDIYPYDKYKEKFGLPKRHAFYNEGLMEINDNPEILKYGVDENAEAFLHRFYDFVRTDDGREWNNVIKNKKMPSVSGKHAVDGNDATTSESKDYLGKKSVHSSSEKKSEPKAKKLKATYDSTDDENEDDNEDLPLTLMFSKKQGVTNKASRSRSDIKNQKQNMLVNKKYTDVVDNESLSSLSSDSDSDTESQPESHLSMATSLSTKKPHSSLQNISSKNVKTACDKPSSTNSVGKKLKLYDELEENIALKKTKKSITKLKLIEDKVKSEQLKRRSQFSIGKRKIDVLSSDSDDRESSLKTRKFLSDDSKLKKKISDAVTDSNSKDRNKCNEKTSTQEIRQHLVHDTPKASVKSVRSKLLSSEFCNHSVTSSIEEHVQFSKFSSPDAVVACKNKKINIYDTCSDDSEILDYEDFNEEDIVKKGKEIATTNERIGKLSEKIKKPKGALRRHIISSDEDGEDVNRLILKDSSVKNHVRDFNDEVSVSSTSIRQNNVDLPSSSSSQNENTNMHKKTSLEVKQNTKLFNDNLRRQFRLESYETEAKLRFINNDIKTSLVKGQENFDSCIAILDQLACLDLKLIMLAKFTEILVTVRKCRRYKGSQQVRIKAFEVLEKFSQIFQFASKEDIFKAEVEFLKSRDASIKASEIRRVGSFRDLFVSNFPGLSSTTGLAKLHDNHTIDSSSALNLNSPFDSAGSGPLTPMQSAEVTSTAPQTTIFNTILPPAFLMPGYEMAKSALGILSSGVVGYGQHTTLPSEDDMDLQVLDSYVEEEDNVEPHVSSVSNNLVFGNFNSGTSCIRGGEHVDLESRLQAIMMGGAGDGSQNMAVYHPEIKNNSGSRRQHPYARLRTESEQEDQELHSMLGV